MPGIATVFVLDVEGPTWIGIEPVPLMDACISCKLEPALEQKLGVKHVYVSRPNPGPLVRAYDSLGAVQPIVFGYLAEASAGACDLIKSVADELAPRYADLYLLESVEAAVGIATDRLREEIGAAVFKAQARVILDRIRYCYRGNRAADARRHLQQARWRSRAEHARSHGRPRGRYSLLHRRP